MTTTNNITIKLVKSTIGRLKSHKDCAKGLGLKRLGSTVTIQETKENLGMINKINYLLEIVRHA